jgi:hypothetical protein
LENIVWQLLVHDSTKRGELYISKNAKFHGFIDNKSLCSKYIQVTKNFDNVIKNSELESKEMFICKKCFEKYNKLF